MTREEKLYSMTMVNLVEVANKLGIKIDKKGAKSKAVAKIIAAENAVEESKESAKVEAVEVVVDNEQNLTDEQYAEIGKEIAEEAKKKLQKEKVSSDESKVDVIAVVEGIIKSFNLDYKRSRDGVGIIVNKKRVLDFWKRTNKARVYISSNDGRFDKISKSKLIINLHDNPNTKSKLNKSFYVDVSNIKSIIELYVL